jgi:hypothetical protein
MIVDLADDRLRLRISLARQGMARLQLDYPAEATYRDRIRTALADLIRPKPAAPEAPNADAGGPCD